MANKQNKVASDFVNNQNNENENNNDVAGLSKEDWMEIIDKYKPELTSAAKWWAENNRLTQKSQVKGSTRQIIISSALIAGIILGAVLLTVFDKIQGETFVAIVSLVIGYLLTLINFSAISPPGIKKKQV